MRCLIAAMIACLTITAGCTSSSHTSSSPAGSHTSREHNSASKRTAGQTSSAPSQPVTAADMQTAPVPADCEHQAGRLVSGKLPGIPSTQGEMTFAWHYQPRDVTQDLVFGDFNHDGVRDAAAVLDCNAGGVEWPNIVCIYANTPKLTLLGTVFLDRYHLPGRDPGEHDDVNHLSYGAGRVTVAWSTEQQDESAATESLSYTASFAVADGQVRMSGLTAVSEVPAAQTFMVDLRKGALGDAAELALPGIAGRAAAVLADHPQARVAYPRCSGEYSGPENVRLVTPNPGPDIFVSRECSLPDGSAAASAVVLGMTETSFATWRVAWVGISGSR